MVITREADYAIRLMLVLAENDDDAARPSRALASVAHVPYELARGLLSRLADAGLLASQRGRHGGYRLARPADDITVAEVLAVAGENLSLNTCVAGPATCAMSSRCAMHPVWDSASNVLRDHLGALTLRQVVAMESPHGPERSC